MKVEMQRKSLLEVLAKAKKGVPTRTVVASMRNVRLSAEDGTLDAVGTDSYTAVIVAAPAQVARKGSISIPPADLERFLKHAASDAVTLTASETALNVVAGDAKATFHGLPDFPPFPTVREGEKIHVDGLAKGLEQVAYAMAEDESRPVLHGVTLTPTKGGINITAADGYRLATAKVKAKGQLPGQIVIHATTVKRILQLCKDRPCALYVDDKPKTWSSPICEVRCDGIVIAGQLVQGTPPNYQQLIPTKGRFVRFARDAMRSALEQVACDKDTNRVKLIARRGILSVINGVDSDKAQANIPVKGGGRIAFDPVFLKDVLCRMDEEAVMRIVSPDEAALFTAKAGTHVLMPIHVHW